MIASYDTIKVKPPYQITSTILELVAKISEQIGVIKAVHLSKPPAELRRKNRIKTIQASLEIEGNTLSELQITAILNDKRILAPEKDIIEVQNAIKVYDQIRDFDPTKLSDLEKAHKILMNGLVKHAGKLRIGNVGVVKGSEVAHIAPDGSLVRPLMLELLRYLKDDNDLVLVKSCVFHYEFEFIHPFIDGNGRMGRLWQTVILMQQHPLFEYLPIETAIKQNQDDYYKALGGSDKLGQSTPFIEFMLSIILDSLKMSLETHNRSLNSNERIDIFRDSIGDKKFTRKDYLQHFREISTATASRDLKTAFESDIITKFGAKRLTSYKFNP